MMDCKQNIQHALPELRASEEKRSDPHGTLEGLLALFHQCTFAGKMCAEHLAGSVTCTGRDISKLF